MATTAAATRVGKFRWTICGLLFMAATINYVDRQVIGILKPTLQTQFGWSEIDYGDIVFAFQLAYAIGYLFAGRVMDVHGAPVAGARITANGPESRRSTTTDAGGAFRLPFLSAGDALHDVIGRREHKVVGAGIAAADLFVDTPVAVLVR